MQDSRPAQLAAASDVCRAQRHRRKEAIIVVGTSLMKEIEDLSARSEDRRVPRLSVFL